MPALSGAAVTQPSSSETGDPHARFRWPSDIWFDCASAPDAMSEARAPRQRYREKLARAVIAPLADRFYAGGGTEIFTDGRSSIL